MARRRIASATWLDLGARLLQELEPRRRGEEEIAHLDPRARRMRGRAWARPWRRRRSPGSRRCRRRAGREVMVKRLTEAIEGSASPRKPSVRMSVRSSSGSLEVQCRSTASASSSRVMPHAVVDHREEGAAAFLQGDGDAPRAGVDGVLDQLLHGAGRPLDDLAGGDPVDQVGGQAAQHCAGGALGFVGARSGRLAPCEFPPSGDDRRCNRRPLSPADLRPPGKASLEAHEAVTPTGLPTTTVVIASSRSRRRATRRTSSALTAPISAARRSR